jgi:hypothetical protein
MIDVTVGRPDSALPSFNPTCVVKCDKHAHYLAAGQVARLGNLRVDCGRRQTQIWRLAQGTIDTVRGSRSRALPKQHTVYTHGNTPCPYMVKE